MPQGNPAVPDESLEQAQHQGGPDTGVRAAGAFSNPPGNARLPPPQQRSPSAFVLRPGAARLSRPLLQRSGTGSGDDDGGESGGAKSGGGSVDSSFTHFVAMLFAAVVTIAMYTIVALPRGLGAAHGDDDRVTLEKLNVTVAAPDFERSETAERLWEPGGRAAARFEQTALLRGLLESGALSKHQHRRPPTVLEARPPRPKRFTLCCGCSPANH